CPKPRPTAGTRRRPKPPPLGLTFAPLLTRPRPSIRRETITPITGSVRAFDAKRAKAREEQTTSRVRSSRPGILPSPFDRDVNAPARLRVAVHLLVAFVEEVFDSRA